MMSTETAVCAGCNRELRPDESVVEVARRDVYCLDTCAIATSVGSLRFLDAVLV